MSMKRQIANLHPRVDILSPIGVGFHCIPVDPKFLVFQTQRKKLINVAGNVNTYKTDWVHCR